MKASISKPTVEQLDQFLKAKKTLPVSYSETFDTRSNFRERRHAALRRKYDYDENRVLLGEGQMVFERARAALSSWKMFPEKWTRIYPADAPIKAGQQVAVLFRILGLCWWNPSEIQYVVDESSRFGFAYGTLPGHVESGEELFLVEMDEEGKVWYSIKAFSRPAYQIVRLVYPFARSSQRQFVQESLAVMKRLAQNTGNDAG